MMGVVVEDAQKQLQLFTKGDVDAVLGQCSLMWDGFELRKVCVCMWVCWVYLYIYITCVCVSV